MEGSHSQLGCCLKPRASRQHQAGGNPSEPLPCPAKQGPALLGLTTSHAHGRCSPSQQAEFKMSFPHTSHRQTGLSEGLHLRSLGIGWAGILLGRLLVHPSTGSLICIRPLPTWPSTGLPSPMTMAECLSMDSQLVTQDSQTRGHIHRDTRLSTLMGLRYEKEPRDQGGRMCYPPMLQTILQHGTKDHHH